MNISILLARGEVGSKNLGDIKGLGPLGEIFYSNPRDISPAANLLTNVISAIVGILTVCAGLWFILQFFIGAFGWLTSGSDKASLENAQKKLTNSVIGLVIVVAAIFIIEIIGNLLGLKILQPGDFILNMWPGAKG